MVEVIPSGEQGKEYALTWLEVMAHMKKWVSERGPNKTAKTAAYPFSPDSIFEQLALADSRFKTEAYRFVLRALGKAAAHSGGEHVSGQDVALAFRSLALEEFGKNALSTLSSWGVCTTGDIGTIVYHLIEAGRLGERPEDKIEDFHALYDFASAFPTE